MRNLKTTIEEFSDLPQREFSRKIDDYIRGDIDQIEKEALESPDLLFRMYTDLLSTEKGIKGQYAILKSDYIVEHIDANGDKDLENKALAKYRNALKPKQRFSLGLNDTIAHVSWLMWKTYPKELALSMERDSLASDLHTARLALDKHRKNGLKDPEGFLEREEDLWVDCVSIIGPTDLDS